MAEELIVHQRKQKRIRKSTKSALSVGDIGDIESSPTLSTVSHISSMIDRNKSRVSIERKTITKKKKSRFLKKYKRNYNFSNNDDDDESIYKSYRTGEDLQSAITSESVTEMNFDCEGKHINFHDSFEMLTFLHKLRGPKFLSELRYFTSLIESKRDVVAEFLRMSGKPIDLAETLERIDVSNLPHVSYICQALTGVLMEIVSHHAEYTKTAVTACQYMLRVHSKVIGDLLESFEVGNRRIALRLLTAFVQVNPHISKLTLSTFGIFSKIRKLNYYFANAKSEQSVEENVRKCYVNFVLSFFTDANVSVIPNLLNRRPILQSLIYGLFFDDCSTVCLMLKRIKKYVLESPDISKNIKMYVFDIECSKCLVRLYDWLGPQGLTSSMSRSNIDLDAPLSKMKVCIYVNPEENEAVATAVHDFLLTLLTSDKHGINFVATSRPWQKHNAIQGKIINFIQKPWLSELKTELIHRVLRTSPECSRQAVCHFSKLIAKYTANNGEFIATANFLAGIISMLDPDLLHNVLRAITASDYIDWVKDICLPFEALSAIRNSNMLASHNFECRFATHRLLLAMIDQYSKYMSITMRRLHADGDNRTTRSFKFDLYNYILTNFPSVDHILQSLNMTISSHMNTKLNSSMALKHLRVTLDLILVICKHNHSFVNMTTSIMDYLKFIVPLYEDEAEGDRKKRHSLWNTQHYIDIELKAIKTVLLLNPNALNSHRELFANALKSFIKIFVNGKGDVQRRSGNLLKELLKSAGIYDTLGIEIDLWLETLRLSDGETVEVVTKVLTEVLKNKKSETKLPANTGSEKNDSFYISNLLPMVLESVRNVKPLDEFLERVCLLLFHYHPRPERITVIYEAKFKTLRRYMRSWINIRRYNMESKDITLPDTFHKLPLIMELQNALLSCNKETNMVTLFGADNEETSFEIDVDEEKYRLSAALKNERLLVIYIQQVLFMVAQLVNKRQLFRTQAEFAAQCIKVFLAVLEAIERDNNKSEDIIYAEDADAIVNDSFLARILRYIFEVRFARISDDDLCCVKSEHSLHYLHFITLITKYCNKLQAFFTYAKNFRLKIVKALANSIGIVDITKKQSATDFIKLIDAFQLTPDNCLNMLELICKNLKHADFFVRTDDGFRPSLYYKLLLFLLSNLTGQRNEVNCEHIVMDLARFYVLFSKRPNSESDLEDYCRAFYNFLYTKQQYIPHLGSRIFTNLFWSRKTRKYDIKLSCLLLQCNNNLNEKFLNLLYEYIYKRELVYPLLEIWFSKNESIDKPLQSIIFDEYGGGLLEAIAEPQRADPFYKENLACSLKIVNTCMPISECINFCKHRFQIRFKTCEPYQLRLINAIYEKAWSTLKKDNIKLRTAMFLNYISLQIQLMSKEIEQQSLMIDMLQLVAYQIFSWFAKIQRVWRALYYGFVDIVKGQIWQTFFKSCLNYCLRTQNTTDISDALKALLLKFVAFLCDKLFMDYGRSDLIKELQPKESVELFTMVCTHPNCSDILNSKKPTQLRTALLSLLYSLAKKSPTLTLRHLDISTILNIIIQFPESNRFAQALVQLYETYFPKEFEKHRCAIEQKDAILYETSQISVKS